MKACLSGTAVRDIMLHTWTAPGFMSDKCEALIPHRC